MVEVDLENKSYRISSKFLGIKFPGAWYTIPNYEYISVFKAKERSTFFSRAGERTMYTYEIKVNFVKGEEVTTVYTAKNEEQGFEIAQEFAQQLGEVRILDSTQSPVMWLDEK